MFMINNVKKRTVLLIDGETGTASLTQSIKQLLIAYNVDVKFTKNLHIISSIDFDEDFEFNLLSQETIDFITNIIEKLQIDTIIFDNLYSLFDNVASSEIQWNNLMNTIRTLQRKNISIILLHHTSDANKGRPIGLSKIPSQAQNHILIEGRESLINDRTKEITKSDEFVRSYRNMKGALIRVVFKKCKTYPSLERLYFKYFLPIPTNGDSQPWIHSPENDEISNNICDTDINISTENDSINIDESNVINFAHSKHNFTATEISKNFEYSRNKTRKILDKLCKLGLIYRSGNTSDTKFYIIQK